MTSNQTLRCGSKHTEEAIIIIIIRQGQVWAEMQTGTDSSWTSLRTSSGHLLLMNQSDYRLLNAVYMLIISNNNNNITHRVIQDTL